MIPNRRFLKLKMSFWADVRLISQEVGYTTRGKGTIKIPSKEEIKNALSKVSLKHSHIINEDLTYTEYGNLLVDYFRYRAETLQNHVKPNLMNVEQAKNLFEDTGKLLKPSCPIPMNKQKGDKQVPAYFTSVINMLIEHYADGIPCDYDPRILTTITLDGMPLRTLSRRVDGAFPSPVNPIAIWEIKEYYHTTTFGSRIADGVYETLLDGMELEEAYVNENIDVKHYFMIDAYYTWWDCGKSYLCRIIDMMQMGYVDEVLFGHEVVERLPSIVNEWVDIYKSR